LASFCPECGGELKYDLTSKNFICNSCGLFASSEKIDELRDRAKRSREDPRRKHHEEYLDWWQSSKKDKQQK
jgi:DNA-directed RNA polymerase subunit M/transcription elongation factor TFIIS